MNYLIDTQILIWYQLTSNKLNPGIYELINDARNVIFVSAITLFEITVKQKIGKLPEFEMPISALSEIVSRDGFTLLDLKTTHIATYADIPLLPQHRDPFDRLLLATALSENIPVISADKNFTLYQPQIQLIVAG